MTQAEPRGRLYQGLAEPPSGEDGPLGSQQRSQDPNGSPPEGRRAAATPGLDSDLERQRPPLYR